MTHFLLGFLTAVALIAVTVIVWAVIVHRRQERQRPMHAIAPVHPQPRGKKGMPYSVDELEAASNQPSDEYHRQLMQWAAGEIRSVGQGKKGVH